MESHERDVLTCMVTWVPANGACDLCGQVGRRVMRVGTNVACGATGVWMDVSGDVVMTQAPLGEAAQRAGRVARFAAMDQRDFERTECLLSR